MDPIYQAVELAVQTTGTQAVADLEAKVLGLTAQINTLAAALQAPNANTVALTGEIAKLKAELASAIKQVDAANYAFKKGSLDGWTPAAIDAAEATKKFGYAAMNASYLVQDMQYGVGAVANNIGVMTQSLANAAPGLNSFIATIGVPGGAAGLGAGIMLAAVAFDVLYKNSEAFKGSVDGVIGGVKSLARDFLIALDPIHAYKTGLEGVEQVIKDLEARPFKVEGDYTAIRELTRYLEEAKKAKEEWDALNNKRTKDEQKAKDEISEAIVESGGGHHKLEDVLLGRAKRDMTFGYADTEKQVKAGAKDAESQAFAYAAKSAGGDTNAVGMALGLQASRAAAEAAEIREEMRKQSVDQIASMVSLSEGDKSLSKLRGALHAPGMEDSLKAAGIDPGRIEGGLYLASPERLHEEDRRKRRAADKKKEEEWNAGEKSRIDEANRKAKTIEDQAKADADQKTARAATAIYPGLDDRLEKAIHDKLRAGATPDAARDSQREYVSGVAKGRLADAGIAQNLVGPATELILRRATENAQNLILEGSLPKLDVKAAAAKAKGAREDKAEDAAQARMMKSVARQGVRLNKQGSEAMYGEQFQAMTGANDAQAAHAGKQVNAMVEKGTNPQAAMGMVYRNMLSELRRLGQINAQQQAMLLESQGFAAEATQILQQQNAQMIRMSASLNRGQVRRPGVGPQFLRGGR